MARYLYFIKWPDIILQSVRPIFVRHGASYVCQLMNRMQSHVKTTTKMSLRPPSFLSVPHGSCLWTGIKYGSREYAMGRNWDCIVRGTYGKDTFCPCYDCWSSYVHRFIKLQSVCRMLMARGKYLNKIT